LLDSLLQEEVTNCIAMSTLTPANLTKLRVAELREKLNEAGLDTDGTKPILLTRLKDHLEAASKTPIKNLNIAEKNDTPSRRSKRLSVSETSSKDNAPATPVKRSKNVDKLSVTEKQIPLTPTRRSRRLSGASLTDPELSSVQSTVNTIAEEEEVKEEENVKEASAISVTEAVVESTGQQDSEKNNEVEKSKETGTAKSKFEVTSAADASKKSEETETNLGEIKSSEEKEAKETKEVREEVVKEVSHATTVPVSEKENVPIEQMLKKVFNSKALPRQKPKSGRFWKGERGQFRQIKRDRGQRHTFEARLKMKEEKLRNRDIAATLMQKKNQVKEELRMKIEENKARKLENEKKIEQYQVIKNPAKLNRGKQSKEAGK